MSDYTAGFNCGFLYNLENITKVKIKAVKFSAFIMQQTVIILNSGLPLIFQNVARA